MSLEKIVAEAMEGNPLNVKELFEEEMRKRVAAALEESYKRKMREADDEDEKNESFSEADLEALIEEMDDETYAEFVEELGQLDELDKATLASYRKKAKGDILKRDAKSDKLKATTQRYVDRGYSRDWDQNKGRDTQISKNNYKNAISKSYVKMAKGKMMQAESLEESLQILAESAEAVAHHNKILDDHHDAHHDKEGFHAHGHPDHLANLRHSHNTIASIHDAHRTLHTHAGNHDAAEEHEDAARLHRECSDMSRARPKSQKTGMFPTGGRYELESHEEYAMHQTNAQEASSDAFKHKLPKH